MSWRFVVFAMAAALAAAPPAYGLPAYSDLILFGDSLSDSGNNSLVFDAQSPDALPSPVPPDRRTPLPIPNQFTGGGLVPTYPYHRQTAAGPFDRYTDGFVWAESFAAWLGVPAMPSLAGGTNFAFAGARTGPAGSSFPFSLTDQVAFFAAGLQGSPAPADALYVVAGGGNNTRDTLDELIASAMAPGASGQELLDVIDAAASDYAQDLTGIVAALQGLGAGEIIVWNTPDAGVSPVVLAGAGLLDPLFTALLGSSFPQTATELAQAMNQELEQALEPFDGVRMFDLFGLVDQVVASPSSFGLLDAVTPCAALPQAPNPGDPTAPFCDPAKFMFWDGLHPTSAGHAIIADAVIAFVPEPGTVVLLLPVAFALVRSRPPRLPIT